MSWSSTRRSLNVMRRSSNTTLRSLNATLPVYYSTPVWMSKARCTSAAASPVTSTSNRQIKIITADELSEHQREVSKLRPISPHFTIYKWPFAGLASGTQRATGFALVLAWSAAGLLALPPIPLTTLPGVIEGIKAVPMMHAVVKGGLGFSFAYHGVKNTLITRQPNLTVANVDDLAKKAIAAGLVTATAAILLL